MINVEADYLFETSWEVCNKVGGIYTVLSSKAQDMMDHYPNYFLIGPYFDQNARIEFSSRPVPENFRRAFQELESEGIKCHYGIWEEVKAKPNVILIEFMGIVGQKNSIKEEYWNDFKIDSLRGYWDFEEPSLWSYCVGKLIERLSQRSLSGKKIVAQFHEWLSGFGLLYLKKNCKNIATVFTTHATILGRTLSGNNIDLYHSLNTINPLTEAYRFNIESKHLTEKAAAINSNAFTTVSEITGLEAEKFLGRKPDVLVYNGLDIERFPSFEDISIKHRISREKIREFLTYYFFPYYTFDMEKNLIFFTIGRFEYHNKGYDLIIKALGKLNDMLKKYQGDVTRTATVIFWVPMEQHGIKLEVLENKNYYMHIKNYVNTNGPDIITRLIYDVIIKKDHPEQDILDESFLSHLKRDLIAFERKGNPPLSTHNIDEINNPLVGAFRDNGLLNRKEDSVKVIIHPVYLDGSDGLVDLSYYDAIVGCHMGLFPSYYEPWGYTPLESMALGVPALTTDLSGFGRFLTTHNVKKDGVYVLQRLNVGEDHVVEEFANILYSFLRNTQQERVDSKLNAKQVSSMADWKIFVENYILAHNTALKNLAASKAN